MNTCTICNEDAVVVYADGTASCGQDDCQQALHENPRFVCPRRGESFFGPIDLSQSPKTDHWRAPRNTGVGLGDAHRTCSYCGSMHPDDVMAAVENGTAELGPTDKNYKVYVNLDGDPHGGKFYLTHLSVEQQERFIDLYNNLLFKKEPAMRVGFPGHFYALPYFMTRKGG